jgi:hypothetical protein
MEGEAELGVARCFSPPCLPGSCSLEQRNETEPHRHQYLHANY